MPRAREAESNRAGCLTSREDPGRAKSGAKGDGPQRSMPDASKLKPVCAEFCRGGGEPETVKSGKGVALPRQVEECKNTALSR